MNEILDGIHAAIQQVAQSPSSLEIPRRDEGLRRELAASERRMRKVLGRMRSAKAQSVPVPFAMPAVQTPEQRAKSAAVMRSALRCRKGRYRSAAQFGMAGNASTVIVSKLAPYLHNLLGDVTKKQSRVIAQAIKRGIDRKWADSTVARLLAAKADLDPERAKVVARTEMARAKSDIALGKKRDSAKVVFTLGNEDACPICRALEGKVFTVRKAAGVIPVHPSCFCFWSDAAKGAKVTRNANPEGCNQYTGKECSRGKVSSRRTSANLSEAEKIPFSERDVRGDDETEPVEGEWGRTPAGDRLYMFKTRAGLGYEIRSLGHSVWGEGIGYDLDFKDSEDRHGITGAGSPIEVFGKVVPALVALLQREQLPIATFTAEEPSRKKLYDRLTNSVADTLPSYRGYRADRGGESVYFLVKRDFANQFERDILPKYRGGAAVTNSFRDSLLRFSALNQFCATGEGGGVDPSCGSSGGKVAFTESQKNAALERLKDLPDAEEGYAHSSFGDVSQVRLKSFGFAGTGSGGVIPEGAEFYTEMELDPADVRYMQSSVTRAGVEKKLNGEWADLEYSSSGLPIVRIDEDGTKVLVDGNHRAVAQVLATGKFRARVTKVKSKKGTPGRYKFKFEKPS